MNSHFENSLIEKKEWIDQITRDYIEKLETQNILGLTTLRSSMEYSLVRGGKRFRPVLCIALAEAFAASPQKVLPFACAVEMIHTYSLIHDDLPCMDNDDFRRGEPTNHKVFGETLALLAGDSLLTESFYLVSHSYFSEPEKGLRLVEELSKAAGYRGMVGGQAIDIKAKDLSYNLEQLKLMHQMKTGALIRVCCEGAAIAIGLPDDKIKLCTEFGEQIGFAFQLADDILDSTEDKIEKGSLPELVGLNETKKWLDQTSQDAHHTLDNLGIKSGFLHDLVEYNRLRLK